MAKITIAGDAVVITSSQKLDDIKMLEKYRPNALVLYETNDSGKKEAVFKVGSTTGKGEIGRYGASFASTTHDDDKLATITMAMPAGVTDAKKAVADMVGVAILNLNKVEEQFAAAIAEVAAEKAAIEANITVA